MKYIFIFISLFSSSVWADVYAVMYGQGISSRHDLPGSSSLMLNLGIGYEVNHFFAEWDAGINIEAPFQDYFSIKDNQQKLQMSVSTGYLMKVASKNYVKLGVGSRAAIFDEDCKVYYDGPYCYRKTEYGPIYKIGYSYETDRKSMIGIEFVSDELSDRRKYGSISVVVDKFF